MKRAASWTVLAAAVCLVAACGGDGGGAGDVAVDAVDVAGEGLPDSAMDAGPDQEAEFVDAAADEAQQDADAEASEDPGPEADAPTEAGDADAEVPPCECLKDQDCAEKGRGLSACESMICDQAACACKAVTLPDSTGCDDGNPCTDPDLCKDGKCEGGANACQCTVDAECAKYDDHDACTGTLFCDKKEIPYVCAVDPKTVPKCQDDLKLPCRTKKCDPATGACDVLFINEGEPCDDKSLCTIEPKCVKGDCVAEQQIACKDDNPCTSDACVFGKGCQFIPNSLPCSDGEVCTVGDLCGDAKCVPGPWDPCDDKNECTKDACVAGAGCGHEKLTGASCDDHDQCTKGDACDAGTCKGGYVVDCDDDNPCTDDSCDKDKGCLHANNALACDDGDACTGPDACAAGKCVSGPALVDCDDHDACTADSCDKATGKCVNEAVACVDKDPCTVDSCDKATGCVHAPFDCDDHDPCTVDTCIAPADTPECKHAAASCDDKDPWTVDSCDPATGCVHACDDKNLCTTDLKDGAGKCQFKPVWCDDGDACTLDLCDPKTGTCTHTLPPCNCDDMNPCTDEACDPATGKWSHVPVDCDDKDLCTADSCDPATGACVNTPKTCWIPEDVCKVAVCDPDDGACVEKDKCVDADPCTIDSCNPVDGNCTFLKKESADNDLCTNDGCDPVTGEIVHTPKSCDDGNKCTVDSCNPATGECVFTPKNCADGDPCTDDACRPSDGMCTHTSKDCNDGNYCTVDYCDSANGQCVHLPKSNDCGLCATQVCNPSDGTDTCVPKDCDDHLPCTIDYCNAVTGACGHVPASCEDGNHCTLDWCDATTGLCQHAPNTAPCATAKCVGLKHFSGATCADGSCPPVVLQDCDDGNPCTDDACDAAAGCSHTPLSTGVCAPATCIGTQYFAASTCSFGTCPAQDMTACDDGKPCNGQEDCDAGAGGCQAGTPWDCNDNNDCTVDTCDETVLCRNTWDPARREGPQGDATCTGGNDEDCDGLVDAADPDCAFRIDAIDPPYGPAGMQIPVVISGGGFEDAAAVTVFVVDGPNTTPVVVGTVTPTTIEATLPTHGTGAVQVKVVKAHVSVSKTFTCEGTASTISWGNFQFPPGPLNVTAGQWTPMLYGQAWLNGISPGGDPSQVVAQVCATAPGVLPATTPAKKCHTATFNAIKGNNWEYMVAFQPPVGTFDLYFRYSNDGGLNWLCGDLDGSSNGCSPGDAVKLFVTP